MTTDAKFAVIDRLNSRVKYRIAPSKIDGVGVFAIRDIQKGQKLYIDHMPEVYALSYGEFGKLFKEVRELLLGRWPQIINGSHFLYPDARMIAYVNHSDEPNIDGINDVALRDIKKGEELTEDYRLIPGWEKIFTFLKTKKQKMV